MKESRKEFIKEGHKAACSEWKGKIEKEFPELFKKNALVVGKWYKSDNCLFNYQKQLSVYGFFRGEWNQENWSWSHYDKDVILATDKEVEKALIKEANKRGFKEGVVFNVTRDLWYNSYGGREGYNTAIDNNFKYLEGSNSIRMNCVVGCMSIYENGVWAEIIKETITKEQAEKELGKTILN
jgi:hypothetical protein